MEFFPNLHAPLGGACISARRQRNGFCIGLGSVAILNGTERMDLVRFLNS